MNEGSNYYYITNKKNLLIIDIDMYAVYSVGLKDHSDHEITMSQQNRQNKK